MDFNTDKADLYPLKGHLCCPNTIEPYRPMFRQEEIISIIITSVLNLM